MPNIGSDSPYASSRYIPTPSFSSMARKINIHKRYILAILTNIGFALIFSVRSNLCTFKVDPIHIQSLKGISEIYFILAYFIVQLPAALLAYKYSPFRIFGLSILCSIVLGLGTPILLKFFHANVLILVGLLHGIFQGAAFPAAHGMWQYWAPPIERATLTSIAYSGCFVGIAFGAQISSWACDALPGDNILVIYGILGIAWYITWLYIVYEHPISHPTITDTELEYLRQSVENPTTTINTINSIPWKAIFTSVPLLATNVAFMCRTWSAIYLFQSDFTDIDFIHEYNIHVIEYPTLMIAFVLPLIGYTADKLLTNTSKSVSFIRKLYISGGLISELLIYIPSILAVQIIKPLLLDIFVSVAIYSFILSGFFVNHLDIAPKYASITMAISNMGNALATILIVFTPIAIPFEAHEDSKTYHIQSLKGISEIYFILAYFIVQLPAALLAYKYSPFRIFGLSILCSIVLGLGTPILLKFFHANVLILVGLLHGIFQGAAFPAAHGMWQYWAPPIERATLTSIAYSGCFVGIAFGAQISSWACDALPGDNILVIYGILGIAWYITWLYIVYEHPISHPTITDTELEYLRQSVENPTTTINTINSIPWKAIFTSVPLLATNVAFMCRTWSAIYLFQSDFTDIDFIHEYNIHVIEYPTLMIAFVLPLIGYTADKLLTNTSKSVSFIRKLYISGGLISELLIYIPSILAVQIIKPLLLDIFVSVAIYSFILSGFFVNHLDIAPKYASITMAISNMGNALATILIVFTPIAIPFEAHEDSKTYNFSMMEDFFIIATITHIIGAILYLVYGSGQLQKWAKPATEMDDNQTISFSNNSIGV